MTVIKILSLDPTIFMRFEHGELRQRVVVELDNQVDPFSGELRIRLGERDLSFPLEKIDLGTRSFDIWLPDIDNPQALVGSIWSGGHEFHRINLTWQPQKKWEVHLVHYSHHDLGYTGLPSHVINEHIGFLDDVLRFCEETQDWPEDSKFRWLIEQGYSLVEFAATRSPQAVERLMHYVHAGQVEITALFGNQILELSSHEELVRLIYPSFEFKRTFGIEIETAVHNDIPGFTWGLASILAAAGVRYFCPGIPSWYFGAGDTRVHPLWDEQRVLSMDIPGAFWWQGPDGAKILVWYNLHGQEWAPTNLQHAITDLPGMLALLERNRYPFDQVMYTIRGGHRDNAPATMQIASIVWEWNQEWAYPRLVTSTCRSFLSGFESCYGADLPTLRGDVPGTDYPVAAACTPKETAVNRSAHELISSGERFAALAALLSETPYPRATLDHAYRDIFYYDEHCWGMHQSGGPAMDGDWAEKSTYAYRAAALAHDVLQKATNRLVDEIKYPDEGYYLTIFNPHSWERTDIVRAPARPWTGCGSPMYWTQRNPEEGLSLVTGSALGRKVVVPPMEVLEQPFRLIDLTSGEDVAYQLSRVTDPQAAQPFAAERLAIGTFQPEYLLEIVFLAEALPPLGYKTYRILPTDSLPVFTSSCQATPSKLTNSFYELEIDPQNYHIIRLLDLGLSRELVDPDSPHPFANILVRSSENGPVTPGSVTSTTLVEHGPVLTTLRRRGHAPGCPQWTQEITLYHSLKRIDVNNRVLRDSTPMLEVFFAFPFQVSHPQFHYEAPAAVIEPLVDQLPGTNTDYYAVQHWADVSTQDSNGEDWGIVWSPLDTHMTEFGGLWPGYVSGAHHGVTPPGYGHPFLEPGSLQNGHIYALAMYNNFRTNFINVHPGESLLRYSFSSHAGDWRTASVWQFGWNALQPLVGVWMRGPRPGRFHPTESFLQINAPNILLTTFKLSEDGQGFVLRLAETQGVATEVKISLPYFQLVEARETSPAEEDHGPLACTEHEIQVRLTPYSIKTIRGVLI